MALHRITRRDLETFTLSMTPKRTYTSGSAGITGSISLFARGSDREKDVYRLSAFDDDDFDDTDLDSILTQATGSNIEGSMEEYMSLGNEKTTTLRNSVAAEIIRQEPPTAYAEATLKKRAITEHLMPYYRASYPSAHFAYSNYHSLNFFTGSDTPEDCTIMYPNQGQYNLTGAFTFDFYVNPRRSFEDAGTIFFLSSSYCVSLHTGSQLDQNGEASRFKLALQLTQSVDVNPRDLVANDYAFFSEDNVLKRNHWHHIAIRWGASAQAGGSGSFIVDGKEQGTFNIPSATLNTGVTGTVLAIGNYLEGTSHEEYFNSKTATRDGLTQLSAATADPSTASPAATLNAEIHDLKIFQGWQPDSKILTGSTIGPDPGVTPSVDTNPLAIKFYLPPFFRKASPTRAFIDTHGGVLQSPFYEIDGTTTTPFNANLSFGVDGLDINVENYLFDFASANHPRLFNLTASVVTDSSDELTANGFLMATGSFARRHYLLMPNDNGRFTPDFEWLIAGTSYMTASAKFSAPLIDDDASFCVNDLGVRAASFINLRSMLSGVIQFKLDQQSGSLFDGIVGIGPENDGSMIGEPGDGLAIYERTRDQSSNAVVWFDISNLFYGHGIRPKSLLIKDTAMTGVAGVLSMSLRDDGHGNVYRADCESPQATWNMLGNVFYNEGIVFLKSPHLGLFGNEGFSVDLEGETTVHTLTIHALAAAGLVNSSSNGSFVPITSSLAHANDEAPVMITGVNFYDRNLNAVMRTNLAQPIFKRNSDRLLFKPKVDF